MKDNFIPSCFTRYAAAIVRMRHPRTSDSIVELDEARRTAHDAVCVYQKVSKDHISHISDNAPDLCVEELAAWLYENIKGYRGEAT